MGKNGVCPNLHVTQGDVANKTNKKAHRQVTTVDVVRAHSLVRGQWVSEAGRYLVDWEVFDLVWNSKPDGKDRWWLAVHPPLDDRGDAQ